MRYIRYAILAVIAIGLISVSMANRGSVVLQLLPTDIADLLGWNFSLTLPLFVVVLGGVAVGVVVGFVWEWLREHKHRRDANRSGREVRKLEREVTRLKKDKTKGQDEVLALLDDA
ncbi:lipopolysaccharide assembly protein LapA domain-containing protein [Pseudodonghicola flavimaris]|uniref:Lipopolysaccharide assembly protein LapA domain-containing protein n=1 Tax=Pseudodonghicola flavimaris TaxID=3050036 RepID=A0ABT7F366_9RHOB|nr:lipopolysaccharide assembly protein LapA domain-containing protein [Pseudodonghicola flavimaris]MDK3019046.1 lipopolysaccharide assembly protein LapA domain-containing protein [Pseudodonghicola flavimaris]